MTPVSLPLDLGWAGITSNLRGKWYCVTSRAGFERTGSFCFLPPGTMSSHVRNWLSWEFPLWLSGLRTWLVSTRMQVWSSASLGGLRIQRCCELWCRLAAIALIQHLAWERPYATGDAAWAEHVCPPRVMCLCCNLPYGSVGRQACGGTWVSRAELSGMGLVPYKQGREQTISLSGTEGALRRHLSANQEGGSCQTPNLRTPSQPPARWEMHFFLMTTPMAHGSAQARGWMGATAAGLCHSSVGSELTATLGSNLQPNGY